jgi:hypothetical protein
MSDRSPIRRGRKNNDDTGERYAIVIVVSAASAVFAAGFDKFRTSLSRITHGGESIFGISVFDGHKI